MIVVSGASGQLGRRTVQRLLELVDAAEVVAVSRTPDRAADMGVVTRRADFDDEPDELVAAFDGARRLLLISTGEVRADGYRVRQHTNAIHAASRAGVEYVVYTSLTGADHTGHPVGAPTADHAATERALAESGLAYTVLRNNMYTDLLLYAARAAVVSGVLASNRGAGATGYVTRDDCAATAAALLVRGGHPEHLLDVTGPAAVTDDQVAAVLSAATGRRVRHQTLTDEQVLADAIGLGRSPLIAQTVAGFGRAAREGRFEVVTDVVARVTGRRPTSVADFLTTHRALLRPA
jgi:NAD(P)H dehydrogenase (quinone)